MDFATVAQDLRTRLDVMLPLHVTRVDSNATIQAVIAELDGPLRRRHVRIAFAAGESLPPVLSDREVLRRALVNVIVNTVESMPVGGLILIRARIKRSDTASAAAVDIEVSDAGSGIPIPMAGLSRGICREVLQAHGVRIELFNNQGTGTTVRLSFHTAGSRQPTGAVR
jgi:two-component system, sporulation sensor kinase E